MTKATATESQTTFKGTSCLFTRYQTCENGMARSLEKAYPILHVHYNLGFRKIDKKTMEVIVRRRLLP